MNHERVKIQLDEMQQEKLYKIEEKGENICFWGLLAAIVIQLLLGADLRQVIGEIVVFAVLSAFLLYASITQGIWSKRTAPTINSNVWYSVIAAVAVGIIFAVKGFVISKQAFSWGRLAVIIGTMIGVYILCFAALEVFRRMYLKRRSNLDGEEKEP